jgi:hypothetical protein
VLRRLYIVRSGIGAEERERERLSSSSGGALSEAISENDTKYVVLTTCPNDKSPLVPRHGHLHHVFGYEQVFL